MPRPLDLRRPPIVHFRKLGRHQADGLAFIEPQEPDRFGTIHIDERLRGRLLLETLIHEIIHQVHPAMQEPDVRRLGRYIALCLWAWGVRLDEEHLKELVEP